VVGLLLESPAVSRRAGLSTSVQADSHQSATPKPAATPGTCPNLVLWSAYIHVLMDEHFQLVQGKTPVAGGYVVLDSTPRFALGGAVAQPCNDEHPGPCGGRHCEDPRGAAWSRVRDPGDPGSVPMVVQEPGPRFGFQLRAGPLKPGHYKYVACPPDRAQDAEGTRLVVRKGACSTVEFRVSR